MSNPLADDEILLGIDLGTTNTCAFYICKSNPYLQAVTFDNGSNILPSCVWYKSDNSVLVGQYAKKNVGNRDRYIVTNSKRVLGQRTTKRSVQTFADNCGCVVNSIDDKPVFVVSKEGKMKTPSDVAADILRKVKERAETLSEKRIKRVMVTFPAHFDNNQRTATLLAIKKAGFKQEQIRMMNEPTAASYCYYPSTNKPLQNILIYDLGGGTFDVSVLQIENNKYKILAYAGDNNLGGADFDAAIANDLELLYEDKYHKSLFEGLDENSISKLRQRVIQTAEQTKIALASIESYEVELDYLSVVDGDGDGGQSLTYTRSRMDAVLTPYITKTVETIDIALQKASLGVHQIDRVLLVGGSSRLLLVKKIINHKFGNDLISSQVNCDESVAQGACLALIRNISRFERITYSLGQHIYYNEEMVECIIPRGSVIPVQCTLESQTSTAYSSSVYCGVSQGNSDRQGLYEPVDNCILLDRYCIENLSSLPVVTIATTFYIDDIGMIHVTEVEKETGRVLVDNRVISWEEPNIDT